MDNNIHFFTVWTHRRAKSIFGADSHPVIRNGELLCFPSEEHAQAECDRLNAASGGSHVHYSVKPAHIRPALANGLHLLAEAFRRASERDIGKTAISAAKSRHRPVDYCGGGGGAGTSVPSAGGTT
jgi:hypothetical protein